MKEEIRYFASPAAEEPFTIALAGVSYCDGSYLIDRACSNVYVFEYVARGTGSVRVGKEPPFAASAGDVYILPKNQAHHYYADARDPWVKYFFNAFGPLIENLLAAYRLTEQHLIHCPQAEPLFQEFREIAFGSGTRDSIFASCGLQLHRILLELHRSCRNVENIPPDAAALRAYLDENLSRQVSLEELAKYVSASPDHVIKLFRKYYRQTPYSYFLGQKMQAARNLLCSTSLPVKEISNRLGYADQHYFSNLFKQYCGCAPKIFREQGNSPAE